MIPFIKKYARLAVICVCLLLCATAYAQVTETIPPDSPLYRVAELLYSKGLITDVIWGQRPFTKDEFIRIVKKSHEEFQSRLAKKEPEDYSSFVDHYSEVDYLRKTFEYAFHELGLDKVEGERNVEFYPLRKLEFTALADTEEPRRIPVSNGQGSINGLISSFSNYREGRPYPYGFANWVEMEMFLKASPYFVFLSRPRLQVVIPRQGPEGVDPNVEVQRLYVATGWRDIRLEVGRDNIYWGQGEFGGVMLSTNPRPLDMIKLESPHPFKLPSFLKHLGYWKGTFFVSNLGPENVHAYPYLYGFKLTLKPCKIFEIGLSETVTMGGQGAQSVTWWQPVAELFPFHKWGGKNIGTDDLSNHEFGILDFRLNLPWLRGLALYYDSFFEDSFWRPMFTPDNLLNQMSFVAGAYLPSLTKRGDVGLRLEYHHMSPMAYRHGQWSDGYTLNRRVIGDALGPTADGIYAKVSWWPSFNMLTDLELAYERFDSSTFALERDIGRGTTNRVLKEKNNPCEYRYRALGSIKVPFSGNLWFKGRAGYEYIKGFNFNVGRNVNNILAEASLEIDLSRLKVASKR